MKIIHPKNSRLPSTYANTSTHEESATKVFKVLQPYMPTRNTSNISDGIICVYNISCDFDRNEDFVIKRDMWFLLSSREKNCSSGFFFFRN